MKLQSSLQYFFWFAFAAFLAASIPHTAYFFATYESMDNAIESWIIAYAIAISIDVTIFLLCTVLASRKNKSVFVWLFILTLTSLSCYLNYEYATQFQSTMLNKAYHAEIAYIGDINPYIASSFPLLIIAFTWISDKLATSHKVKSVEELAKEVYELEQRKEIEQRLHQLHRGKISRFINEAVDTYSEVKNHVIATTTQSTLVETQVGTPAISQPITPEETQVTPEKNTDSLIPVAVASNDHISENTGKLQRYTPKTRQQ